MIEKCGAVASNDRIALNVDARPFAQTLALAFLKQLRGKNHRHQPRGRAGANVPGRSERVTAECLEMMEQTHKTLAGLMKTQATEAD
jgi:hypothetical protein